MTFIRKLKKPKDMTDDELIEEFRIIQKIAKQRGEHIPLPVTARDQVGNGQTPPIHRGETEKQLQALRADFEKDSETSKKFEQSLPASSKKVDTQQVAQNTANDVIKGVSKANRLHDAGTGLAKGIGAMPGIGKGKAQELLNLYTEAGEQGISFKRAEKIYGNIPGARAAYQKGIDNSKQHNKRHQQ